MSNKEIEKEQFLRIYYNPSLGFQGPDELYEKVKNLQKDYGLNFSKEIKNFINHQETYQLHKEIRRKKEYLTTFVGEIGEQIQIDLIDMRKYKKLNRGYCWIITMIDIFSRCKKFKIKL